jgi:predicted GNAT family N-acyltransferase
MKIVIRPLMNEKDREACYAVRIEVFVEEQKVPLEEEIDAEDEKAWHFVVENEGRVVGTARLLAKGNGVGKIGRVALLPEYRGRGIGRDLMWYVMGAGFRRFETLILDAQVSVIPFYEKLGFEVEGGVFLDAGIEHRRMVCSREGIRRRQSR